MENKINFKDKRVIVNMVLAISSLLIISIGAAYAYYSVTQTSISNFTDVTTTIGGVAGTGLVLFDGVTGELTLDIDMEDMQKGVENISYYASYDGKTTTPTEEYIGIASAGLENDPYRYYCTYTLNVTHSGNPDLYTLFSSDNYENKSSGQIILTIDGVDYDLNSGWPSTVTGSFYVDLANPYPISAGLRFVNLVNVDQSYLDEAEIEIAIDLAHNGLTCDIVGV